MEAQLHLLPSEPGDDGRPHDDSWRLDEPTRVLGRQGVASARSALRAAVRHRHADSHDQPASAA